MYFFLPADQNTDNKLIYGILSSPCRSSKNASTQFVMSVTHALKT